jgi:hypothetical protein
MKLRKHVRNLAIGTMLTLGVVIVPAVQIHAQPNAHPQPKNLCAATDGHGNWNFWVPGEVVRLGDGHRYKCGADGNWIQVDLEAPPTDETLGPTVPLPTSVSPAS